MIFKASAERFEINASAVLSLLAKEILDILIMVKKIDKRLKQIFCI
jgi:hypothetical protein